MIKLRECLIEDKETLIACLNNESVIQFLSTKIPSPYTEEDAHWWITEGSKADIIRAITYNNEFAGCIGVNRGEFEYSRSGELGYWIAQEHWRKGIAYCAIQQITELVFTTTDIVRLYAPVFSSNQPSMQLLLKSGFAQEAVLKQAIFKDEQFYDGYIFTKHKTMLDTGIN